MNLLCCRRDLSSFSLILYLSCSLFTSPIHSWNLPARSPPDTCSASLALRNDICDWHSVSSWRIDSYEQKTLRKNNPFEIFSEIKKTFLPLKKSSPILILSVRFFQIKDVARITGSKNLYPVDSETLSDLGNRSLGLTMLHPNISRKVSSPILV